MDRRKVVKTLGISAALLTTGLISACKGGDDEAQKELQELRDSIKETENKPASERDKKIVNRTEMQISDIENPTDFELKHTPEIKLGNTDDLFFTEIMITIGTGIIHPLTDDHWIDYIKLYTDDKLVGEIDYEPGMALGYAEFKIKTENVSVLKAECGCNLHGIWHSEIKLHS